MGLFDFLKKKTQNPKNKDEVKHVQERNPSSKIKMDIETQRNGYLELGEICLNKTMRIEYSEFIRNLNDYTDDEEYMTTLNYVIDSLYNKGNYFIISLDWKQEITSLTHGVNYILKETFSRQIDLPKQEDYGARASVSFENVFKDFDKAMNSNGYQLSFIDTNTDQYVIVVHKIEDLQKAKSAIRKIGYDCLNSKSRKISG